MKEISGSHNSLSKFATSYRPLWKGVAKNYVAAVTITVDLIPHIYIMFGLVLWEVTIKRLQASRELCGHKCITVIINITTAAQSVHHFVATLSLSRVKIYAGIVPITVHHHLVQPG